MPMLRNRFVQIGLGAAFIVLIIWWRAGRRPPAPPPEKEIILVASRDIQPGEALARDNVIQVKATKVPEEALSDWREIEGAYALAFIRKGAPILKTLVAKGLSDLLHGGWRAMIFETTETEMPIVREIRKGDTIDIVAVYEPPAGIEGRPYSGPVAQGVQVLNVVRTVEPVKAERGQEEAPREGERRPPPKVVKVQLILAATPDQAERIELARQVAKVNFLLRPRLLTPPSQEVLAVGWNPQELFPGAFPKEPKEAPKPPPPPLPKPPEPQIIKPPVMGQIPAPAPVVEVNMEKIRQIVQEETLRQSKGLFKAIEMLEAELKKPPPIPQPFEEVKKRKVEVIRGTERSEVEVEG